MNTNKKVVAAALVATAIGSGLFAAKQTYAAETTSEMPMSSLVQAIATKFNLNTSDVQAVFDQNRAEMQSKMQASYEAKLSQYVTDGKITEEQKQLIIAKHKELEANRQSNWENMKNMTKEQRKTAMEAEKTALESWAKEHNIDPMYLRVGRGGHGRGGHGPGMKAQ